MFPIPLPLLSYMATNSLKSCTCTVSTLLEAYHEIVGNSLFFVMINFIQRTSLFMRRGCENILNTLLFMHMKLYQANNWYMKIHGIITSISWVCDCFYSWNQSTFTAMKCSWYTREIFSSPKTGKARVCLQKLVVYWYRQK